MSTLNSTILVLTIVIQVLLFIFLIMQIKSKTFLAEKSAFECGFSMTMKKNKMFSINYFFMTIIFLMFDLEVVFIAPMTIFNSNIVMILMVSVLILYFTLMLSMEWMNSMLEWQS